MSIGKFRGKYLFFRKSLLLPFSYNERKHYCHLPKVYGVFSKLQGVYRKIEEVFFEDFFYLLIFSSDYEQNNFVFFLKFFFS